MESDGDEPTREGALDGVSDADAPWSSLDANHKIDNDKSLVGTLTDDCAELRGRKHERKVNGADEELLATTNAEGHKRGKDSNGRNNTSNGGVVRSSGEDECEAIERDHLTLNFYWKGDSSFLDVV